MAADERGTWVYGVVPGDAPLAELARRQDGLPRVRVVEAGDLAAVVGQVPENDAQGTRDQALAHAHVLEAVAADTPVVPFRFGTIAGTDEDVGTQLLEGQRDQLRALLDKVDGNIQMTLKVNYREDVVLREIVDDYPEIQRLREATAGQSEEAVHDELVKLGELVNNAIDEHRSRDAAELLEGLRPVSLAIVEEPLEKELMLLNAACLVARDSRPEFEDTLERLAGERSERMTFRLLGPLPTYSFLDTEETAWA